MNCEYIRILIIFSDINSRARTKNSHVQDQTYPLAPLVTLEGHPAPSFPPTLAILSQMNAQELNTLLVAYNLPLDGGAAVKRQRLKQFFGVPNT
jgi:hypothetical protein